MSAPDLETLVRLAAAMGGTESARLVLGGRTMHVERAATHSAAPTSVFELPIIDSEGGAGRLEITAVEPPDGEAVDALMLIVGLIENQLDAELEREAGQELFARLLDSEHALVESTDRLEASNQQLEQFAYIAAHELLHPLRAVSAFAELLPDLVQAGDAGAGGRVEMCVANIRDGTRRMQTQVSELLALSAVSDDAAELEVIDLHDIVTQALDSAQVPLHDVGADVSIGWLPFIRGRQVQLQSVFHNLITNAVRYRSPERTLELTIRGELAGGFARVTVADNGSGIAEVDAKRIFGVFERASEDSEGSGIGLALTRRIVEHVGGSIEVSSEPGAGSVFTLQFPRLGADNQTVILAGEEPPPSLSLTL